MKKITRKKKLQILKISSLVMAGLIATSVIVAVQHLSEYSNLLGEAQVKYFDVIDRTIDNNIQKGEFRFDTNSRFYADPYGESTSTYPFTRRAVSHRKSIFFNQKELKSRLIKSSTKDNNKGGIQLWDYYNEDFFKENILMRVASGYDWKYIKTVFNKKTNKLVNTFISVPQNKTIYEQWKGVEKDEGRPVAPLRPTVIRLDGKNSIFVAFKKSDLNSNDLDNISFGRNSIHNKINLWNFLKEEKKAGKF